MSQTLDDIVQLSVRLVQEAPTLDPAVVRGLRGALENVGSPLALTLSRIVELVDEGLVDPAISLPTIAEACATLVAGLQGKVDQRVLDAAQYQIDTLTPMPNRADKTPRIGTPDVQVIDLVRRPKGPETS